MIRVFDFFSGCGGTSRGFKDFGFKIIGALDFDKDAAETFRQNFPRAKFVEKDIREVRAESISNIIGKRDAPLLFCGCAPCQPFSTQIKLGTGAGKHEDPRKTLLSEFQRFIEYWKPEFVFLENVPGLQNVDRSSGVYKKFKDSLNQMDYQTDSLVVSASDFGVPQIRKRFVLVAGAKGFDIKRIEDAIPARDNKMPTVREFISDLPSLAAGEAHKVVSNHVAAKLSPLNLTRIKKTKEGGDRRDWPKKLRVGCHENYKGHTDVYGRMRWDTPAPTLTTRCISYSNGRFGHPEQHRAISLREAARLQTFPDDFVFSGTLISVARQIGNAVPPKMAENLSRCFV